MISDTVVYEFIRAWKRSIYGDIPAWPAESLIAQIVKFGIRLDPARNPPQAITDAETLAQIVIEMHDEKPKLYLCFVAYHLAIINDERHPKMKYKDRAICLGLNRKTFTRRVQRGFDFCRGRLEERLDNVSPLFV